MAELTIGFLGAGQMARALACGVVNARVAQAAHIVAHDPVAEAAEQFRAAVPGGRLLPTNAAVIESANLIVLAVKPQSLSQVQAEIAAAPVGERCFVSILAGMPLDRLYQALRSRRVVRVMPNTPCLVNAGATAYCLGAEATAADAELVQRIFSAVGMAIEVAESQLDAVTGLSGSGPAFVFAMIEALSDGGVRAGLPRQTAARLAAQTVFGSARLLLDTGEHPALLKDRVASPGGTTIAGLQVLERGGFRSAVIDAVAAAADRSRELGKN